MSDPQTIRLLSQTELFGLLPTDALDGIAGRSTERRYEAGETIFRQGDIGEAVFVVAEGTVKVFTATTDGQEMVLASLIPPATFGELALMDGQRRTATAEALEPTRLLAVARTDFAILMREHPSVSDALYRAVAGLLRRVLDRTSDLVFLDLHGRVAQLLLDRADSERPTDDGTVALDLVDTQALLAESCGASGSTIEQILKNFEARGYVALEGGKIVLKEPELLAQRAGA